MVDLQGKFRKELGFLGEKFVKNEYYEEGNVPEKSVDVEIAIKLAKNNNFRNMIINKIKTNKNSLYNDETPIRLLEQFFINKFKI